MANHSLETALFLQTLHRVQFYLKLLGLQFDERDNRKNIWENLRFRWFFLFNFSLLNITTGGETAWLIKGVSTRKSFVELCYQGPCLTLCIVCNFICLYFVKHRCRIVKLIAQIRTLQSMSTELEEVDVNFLRNQIKIFYVAVNTITAMKCLGIVAFAISPLVIISSTYYHTGKLKLVLPFLIVLPFDLFDIRYWPILYIHQMYSALMACLLLLAPSFLCYACSTFIIFQFHLLKKDLKGLIPYENHSNTYLSRENLRTEFKKIVNRHIKLIQCVDLMKEIYSETNLFNVIASSILICLTGFNAMTIEDLALAVPFLPFLLIDFIQIFFICYYGDMLMRFSTNISNGAYECQWYKSETIIVKDLMLLSLRAQKPCKLTASRFSDINFKTFTKILSTSWSYFALLKSLYRRN